MAVQSAKITALYERLSDADEIQGDSMSIQNQKIMLEKYAADHGFTNIQHFWDDGVSGTLFKRKGLSAMLEEVRAGNVSVVIFKDGSRIGRDVLEVGLLKREFENNNVRYIAASDGLDSANGFDIMSIFRDVFNEYFVADTSKKIRAVKYSNALLGKVSSKPPFGYMIDEKDKSVWHIDNEAAELVKEMFRRIIGGEGSCIIANDFNRRGIVIPTVYYQMKKGDSPQGIRYWASKTIDDMVQNPAYIGRYIANKHTTPSYKNHKRIIRPEEDWVVIERHHAEIVDIETFEIVQRIRANRRRMTKRGDIGMLSGLVFCPDCQSKLNLAHYGKWDYYICSKYRASTEYAVKKCTRHGISRGDLEKIVLSKIQSTVSLAKEDKEKFAEQINKFANKDIEKTIKAKAYELRKSERRISELDRLIAHIYEDNVKGKLSDERFQKMMSDYEAEQGKLKVGAITLKTELEELKNKTSNLQGFMNLVEQYGEITELTATLARSFIEKIIVHEPVYKTSSKKVKESQEVQIFLTFIGEFNIEN
ncbi:recombinase [Clostridia bacterium]|nr:recombinase [Clostridia bacterium]